MASPIGDAAQVERLATMFESAADEVVRTGRARASRLGHASWQSAGADRCRQRAANRAHACEDEAREMQDLARALRRHANWIRETESELRDLERRISSWAAVHPANPTDPAPDASLIAWWPPPLDPAWRDLAARLRANGAYF
jgi:hypothetical protein